MSTFGVQKKCFLLSFKIRAWEHTWWHKKKHGHRTFNPEQKAESPESTLEGEHQEKPAVHHRTANAQRVAHRTPHRIRRMGSSASQVPHNSAARLGFEHVKGGASAA